MKAIKIGIACGTEFGKGECVQGFMGKCAGKRSLGRPRRTCEGNTKTCTKDTQCEVE
jgi:hypothetical protein